MIDRTSNTFDGFNRLKEIESVKDGVRTLAKYTYNGDDLRVKKSVKKSDDGYTEKITNYLYDRQYVILETDAGNAVKARYVRGVNYVARMEASGKLSYFLYNGHGDVVQTVAANGEVENQYDYDIWGNPTLTVESYDCGIRFAGEYFDSESGLYYLRARYYDPNLGRFLSEDSYCGEDGNPLSLNRYTYAHNNPIRYVDPSGHFAIPFRTKSIDEEKDKIVGSALGLLAKILEKSPKIPKTFESDWDADININLDDESDDESVNRVIIPPAYPIISPIEPDSENVKNNNDNTNNNPNPNNNIVHTRTTINIPSQPDSNNGKTGQLGDHEIVEINGEVYIKVNPGDCVSTITQELSGEYNESQWEEFKKANGLTDTTIYPDSYYKVTNIILTNNYLNTFNPQVNDQKIDNIPSPEEVIQSSIENIPSQGPAIQSTIDNDALNIVQNSIDVTNISGGSLTGLTDYNLGEKVSVIGGVWPALEAMGNGIAESAAKLKNVSRQFKKTIAKIGIKNDPLFGMGNKSLGLLNTIGNHLESVAKLKSTYILAGIGLVADMYGDYKQLEEADASDAEIKGTMVNDAAWGVGNAAASTIAATATTGAVAWALAGTAVCPVAGTLAGLIVGIGVSLAIDYGLSGKKETTRSLLVNQFKRDEEDGE